MGMLGPRVVAGLTLAAIALVAACASDPPEDFVPPDGSSSSSGSTVPGGDGGASSSGGSSGTSGGSSSGSSGGGDASNETGANADCSKMTSKVDDRPACDACVKAKCCSQIQACEASAACKAAQDCLAKCSDDDFGCILDCSATGGSGTPLLEELGSCAASQCKTECPSGGFDFDGGFPF